MAKRILLWDPRFPAAKPVRRLVDDAIASAAVRANVAAAADPAEAGALAAGAAVSSANPVEVLLQHGPVGQPAIDRVTLPFAVAAIAITLGLAAPAASTAQIAAAPAPAWILASGSWDDTAPFNDMQNWKDS